MAELLTWPAARPAAPVAVASPPNDAPAPSVPMDAPMAAGFRIAAAVSGVLAAALGALGFLGQLTRTPELASWRLDWVSMKANTGALLFALGVALAAVCLDPRARRAALVVGAVTSAVGLLTLFEYLFGWDLPIDDALVREPLGAVGTTHPGRMAIVTAVCFGFEGVALVALVQPALRLAWLPSVAALPPLLVGFVAGVGYAFGADELYSWAGHITAIAATTATALVLLSTGLVLARIETGVLRWLASPSSGGVMLRRLLPVALVSPVLFAWLNIRGLAGNMFDTAEFAAASVAGLTVLVFSAALIWCAAWLDDLDAERRAGQVRITGLNEQLTQQVRALEGANRELEGFAYAMGHVLRAPLRAMDGFSRILVDDYGPKLDAEGARMLGVVRSNARDMGLLIDGIGEFLRLGRAPLSLAPVDMAELARSALVELKPGMERRDVRIALAALPPAQADREMMRRVWQQLLDNAVKFTAGRDPAEIEVGARPGERETVYFVRDNGVGFEMKYAEKLWGVFNRLHGAEFAGDGMGLAIVQRIVLRHGGRVWAEGEPGTGATFFFTLPTPEAGHA